MLNGEDQAQRAGNRVVDFEFAQQRSLTSSKFSEHLKKRGLDVEWEVLHRLWAFGFVLPIAVTDLAISGTDGIVGNDRFVRASFGHQPGYFTDKGVPSGLLTEEVPAIRIDSVPVKLEGSLIWHPYQFIEVARLIDQLLRKSTLRFILRNRNEVTDNYIKNRDREWKYTCSESYQSSEQAQRRMISMLIEFDPMYRPNVVSKWVGYYSTSHDDYIAWRNKQDPQRILTEMGVECDVIKKWHRDLSMAGQLKDPFGPFAGAVRSGNRNSLERLRGDALLAQDYYDAAHLLRIIAQTACNATLDYELDVARIGPTTGPTAIDQRIRARRLGIAQEPLLVWVLEGSTEEDYIRAYAEAVGLDLQAHGIRLHQARGISYFTSSDFSELLQRYQAEKVFVYVTSDTDSDGRNKTNNTSGEATDPEHVNALRRYDAIGRLPAGLTIWERNFVESNFTFRELGVITTEILAEHDIDEVVEGGLIKQRMNQKIDGSERLLQITAEGAIEKILASKGVYDVVKGRTWGERLANFAVAHVRTELDGEGQIRDARQMNRDIYMLARARKSDYDLNVKTRPSERKREQASAIAKKSAQRKVALAKRFNKLMESDQK